MTFLVSIVDSRQSEYFEHGPMNAYHGIAQVRTVLLRLAGQTLAQNHIFSILNIYIFIFVIEFILVGRE